MFNYQQYRILILIALLCFSSIFLQGCKNGVTDEEEHEQIVEIYLHMISTDTKLEDIDNHVELTKEVIDKYYKDNEEKREYWNDELNEVVEATKNSLSTDNSFTYDSSISSLQVQDDWTWTIDGNYSYIKGSVKNTGTKPISYFEILAEYTDTEGNVLDSDYTNSNLTLNVGDMKEFTIMHENNDKYKLVNLSIKKVIF